MSDLLVVIPTWDGEKGQRTMKQWEEKQAGDVEYAIVSPSSEEFRNGVLQGMAYGAQQLAELDPAPAGVVFSHDDVEMLEEGWDTTIVEFLDDHPQCGLVGLGGAKGLGSNDIYKVPYRFQQLVRLTFKSNMRDFHIHGTKLEKPERVAVLDGFFQAFSLRAYEEMGGWEEAVKDGMPPHHMYDAWAACRMKELGYEVWALPIKCHHRGGETAVTAAYHNWAKAHGWDEGDVSVHQKAHEVCYLRFRDVLPIRES